MTLEQLVGKLMRLRTELLAAYKARSCDLSYLERLNDDIASTERAIEHTQPADEQTSDTLPGFVW